MLLLEVLNQNTSLFTKCIQVTRRGKWLSHARANMKSTEVCNFVVHIAHLYNDWRIKATQQKTQLKWHTKLLHQVKSRPAFSLNSYKRKRLKTILMTKRLTASAFRQIRASNAFLNTLYLSYCSTRTHVPLNKKTSFQWRIDIRAQIAWTSQTLSSCPDFLKTSQENR